MESARKSRYEEVTNMESRTPTQWVPSNLDDAADRTFEGARATTLAQADLERIVFLDFDGVMQNGYERGQSLPAERFAGLRADMAERFGDDVFLAVGNDDIAAVLYDWRPEAVRSLRRIVDETGARIAVSSSWRFYDGDDQLRCLLALHGLDGAFAGAVSRDLSVSREDAIRLFVAQRGAPNCAYVALDDARLEGLDGHFVRVRGTLSMEDAARAVVILGAGDD